MGNCLRRESPMQWGGEDWSFSPVPNDFYIVSNARQLRQTPGFHQVLDEQGDENILLGGEKKGKLINSTTTEAVEVKIKITKKQLEEMLGKVDVKQLSVQQVVAHLITVSDKFEAQHRSWRPNLQSIPE
ncbi:hypothetical protein LINPERHAP1_LOCUS22264 [Linum perenne]